MPWRWPGIERRAGQQRGQAAACFAAAARAQSRESPKPIEGKAGPYREHMRSKKQQRQRQSYRGSEAMRCARTRPARTRRRARCPRELRSDPPAGRPTFPFPVNAAIIADIPKGERSRRRRRHSLPRCCDVSFSLRLGPACRLIRCSTTPVSTTANKRKKKNVCDGFNRFFSTDAGS